MSLQLDKRHRAMLREMGVRVWLPTAPAETALPAEPQDVSEPAPIADPAPAALTDGTVVASPVRPSVPAPAPATVHTASSGADMASATAAWALGTPAVLYADASAPASTGPRWLVLIELPQTALARTPFQPFEGDAGKLLDNMLRAARLHQGATVHLAPLARLAASAEPSGALDTALPALMASSQPDVLLVMGRLAGQAVVGSGEPFGKLRGQVHTVQGVRTVLTYDATYLLRSPADKARAWDDLCLALTVVAGL